MSLLFVDSFDHYLGTNPPEFASKWDSVSFGTGLTVGPTAAKDGPNGLSMGHLARFSKNTFGVSGVVVGFHNKFENLVGTAGDHLLLHFREGARVHLSVHFDLALSVFEVRRGSTVVAVGTLALADRTEWHHLEFRCRIADVGGEIVMNVDGVEHLSFMGDTQNGGTAVLDNVLFQSADQSVSTKYLDNIYICSTDGASNNDFLGPSRVLARHPDADGNYSDWTNTASTSVNNYTYVDEVDPDGDTSFVEDGVVGTKDSYGFQALALDPGETVLGLQVVQYSRKTDTDPIASRTFQRIGGADYPNPDHNLAEQYAYYEDPLDVSPATGVAWTEAEVDAAEFGIEVRP